VPRRIRVVVDSTLPFSVGMIQELGPGVVLLGEPSRSGVLLTIDLLVSTSQPWVDILVSCDEAGPGPLTFAFVLHAASIDASASYAHLIHGQ
jgi:hypothetical protein